MAPGMAIASEGGDNNIYNGKITAFVILSCMMAGMGGVIFGYDIGISGGVTSMEPFLEKFFPEVHRKMKEDTKISNYCKFDSQLLTSFTSSLYVAGLVASFVASSVTRAFGRKPSVLMGGAAFLAGSALGGAAVNVYMLIFGRLLLGVGVGFANQSVPLYLSEMAPARYRGAINNGFQFSIGIGALAANFINYGTEQIKGGWGWRVSLALAAVPASILTLGALFLPETPNSLIQRKSDHQKAKLMLQRVRGTNDVQAEFDDLLKASSTAKTINHPFKKIIQRKYRPQLVMATAIPFFQQVTGINVIAFYAPLLFRTIGLETKNVPIEQMDGVWREHWFWKKYVGEVDEQASMAVGLAISSEGGQDYNGKITSFVVLSCIVAATGGLIFGYDLGISGGVTSMEPFLEKFFPKVYRKMKEDTHISNYCKFDSQLLTSFTSSLYIAGLIASLFASTVTKAFGRRASILVGGTAFLAGSALGGAALNIYMLIFGHKAAALAADNMAVGLAITCEGGQHYKGKVTRFVVLSCIVAATGGLIFGYDIGISGGVTSMEPFLKKFFPEVYKNMREDTKVSNYCKFDSQLLTTFTSSLYISGILGSLIASSVTRALGRKVSILIGGVAFLAGSALGGSAFNIYMLIFGRLLLGVGIGFGNQSVPLYLSEMAPPKYRGTFNIGFQLCGAIGVLSANLLNYGTQKIKGGWGWRISLAMAAAPASILTIGAIFLPETPNSIIQRSNDHQKAQKMLQRVRGIADVEAELNDLIRASSISKSITHPFKNIVQRKYRPQLVMAILIPFFQQVTGINIVGLYSPVLFRTLKLGESTSLLLSALVAGGMGTVFAIVSMILADKFGRKVLFLVGGIQMLVSQVMIGSIMAAQLGDHGGFSEGYAYLILVMVCLYSSGYCYSWGPLAWLVPSEIFPLEIRSAGQSITVAVNFLFTFLTAQTFLPMLCHFKAGIFFFFGGLVLIMTTFMHFFLPETKNVPIEQMDKVWREHWFWMKIVEDVGEESKKIQQAL
ncbi:hypothetical protein CUMW_218890 [Citrus unshiu]|uniref:Major facilitator superfamily (MFS) profile domain-containing protein n=1 Tax=Citrus unshiu TaxID=55188 RepID=A0A2H5QDA6_CITUN|nr:hypothetical protein CUMW_218890 [Citrus unshiu]